MRLQPTHIGGRQATIRQQRQQAESHQFAVTHPHRLRRVGDEANTNAVVKQRLQGGRRIRKAHHPREGRPREGLQQHLSVQRRARHACRSQGGDEDVSQMGRAQADASACPGVFDTQTILLRHKLQWRGLLSVAIKCGQHAAQHLTNMLCPGRAAPALTPVDQGAIEVEEDGPEHVRHGHQAARRPTASGRCSRSTLGCARVAAACARRS